MAFTLSKKSLRYKKTAAHKITIIVKKSLTLSDNEKKLTPNELSNSIAMYVGCAMRTMNQQLACSFRCARRTLHWFIELIRAS